MSFNNNDNNKALPITRANYEEYFLLYMDDELTAEEKNSVEAFLASHPDLQAEMDILLSTKLSSENIGLEDKSFLLADQMKLTTIDESLLLYIDNELGKEEKENVEKKIDADKEFALQHQALLQTKLDPTEEVIYPYKKELYRHTEKRIAPYWLRIAAAIIIMFGIGAVWMLTNKPQPDTNVATVPVENPHAEKIKEQPFAEPEITDVAVAKQEQQDKEKTEAVPVLAKSNEKNISERSVAKQKAKQANEYVPQVKNNNLPVRVVDEPAEPVIAVTEPKVSPKQSINTPDVTTALADTYNKQQTSPTTAVVTEDVAKVDKKSSLKGFLRKATRFIERRTNISATNENDELLIGAVALKL
jgi:hypothetical protein